MLTKLIFTAAVIALVVFLVKFRQRSGRVSEYEVYRGRLGERSFETVDGRQVRLAETERLEVATSP